MGLVIASTKVRSRATPMGLSSAVMLDAQRLRARMEERQVSQAGLARAVGVSTTTIRKLVNGGGYGSKHLHRIARELGTTPAYLEGEIDDPGEGAPPPMPAPTVQHLTMLVALPTEEALAEAFRALLSVSRDMNEEELAQELARRLPLVLRVAGEAIVGLPTAAGVGPAAAEELQAEAPLATRRAAGSR